MKFKEAKARPLGNQKLSHDTETQIKEGGRKFKRNSITASRQLDLSRNFDDPVVGLAEDTKRNLSMTVILAV